MTAPHISCPLKRLLLKCLSHETENERDGWLQDAIDAGAFTEAEGEVIRLAISMSEREAA